MKKTIGCFILSFGMIIPTVSFAKSICNYYQNFYLSLPSDDSKYDKNKIISMNLKKHPELDESVLYAMSEVHDDLVECESTLFCYVNLNHYGQAKSFRLKCENGSLERYLDLE